MSDMRETLMGIIARDVMDVEASADAIIAFMDEALKNERNKTIAGIAHMLTQAGYISEGSIVASMGHTPVTRLLTPPPQHDTPKP